MLSADQLANLLLGFGLTFIGSVIGFFIARHFRAKDKSEDKLESIKDSEVKKLEIKLDRLDMKLDQMIARQETMREDLGRIKMTQDAIWRKLDELSVEQRDLRGRQDRIQERL